MKLSDAIECPAFPCNPIPFANGIAEGCREHGSDFIRSREGKRILYILIALSYGQLATVDLCNEYSALTALPSALTAEDPVDLAVA